MWKLEELSVDEEFGKRTPEEFRASLAAEAEVELVRMYRTEYARWEQDADEPEQIGTLAVVWKVSEVVPCECGFDPSDEDDVCVCDTLAAALERELRGWDVYPTSVWEPSSMPWDRADEHLWVSATETYEHERDTRYQYSLHVEGVAPEVRAALFAAVGVEEVQG